MTIKGYMIFQTVNKKGMSVKGDGNDPRFGRIYSSKEDARDFLVSLIATIKHEQSIGWRTERNLDPTFEGGLDWLIQEVTVDVPEENMKKRKWELP